MEEKISFYDERIKLKKLELIGLNKSYNIISLLRILTIISAIGFLYYCYVKSSMIFAIILLIYVFT